MSRNPEHIAATTSHTRRGGRDVFRYGVDYVLIDPDVRSGPPLFSRSRFNLASVHDRNHGGAPIGPNDQITVEKLMHVSPFQDVAGDYGFHFDIRPDKIAIRIDFRSGNSGMVATLTGPRAPLSNVSILTELLRRPAGAMRTIALIYWQALCLKLKGARFRDRPTPPNQEVS
jgi:DUF1365 family protein